MGNTFKTAFLLTVLTLLLMFIGRMLGGPNGMLLALAVAAILNFVSYFFSDKLALAMYHAQPVTREGLPRPADAEDLRDPHRISQRLRHRPQS